MGEDYSIVGVVVQPDRQSLAQLAFGRFMAQTGVQTRTQQMQLGLAHGSLQAEHETVVVVARVIETVGIGDERVGQRAQIQQVIPVGVTPSQARHLLAEHEADLAKSGGSHQRLEA